MPSLRRALIFVHRWLGVALSVPVCIWFLSGIGMMYWDFPNVDAQDRLARSPAIDASRIAVSPGEALAKLDAAQRVGDVRLATIDGRPAYRLRIGRSDALVFADTGDVRRQVSPDVIRRSAEAWTGLAAADARMDAVTSVDQWTVQGALRTMRPLWKFSWPSGEQVYVSGASGEVVQYTTAASRVEAYLGPIPHWLYFTPLREHQEVWTRVVDWSSAVASTAAILGLVIGVWMYSPKRRYVKPRPGAALPYTGVKLWHAALGLVFGLAAVTWTFSGLLSMDPFPTRAAGGSEVVARIAQALRGRLDVSAFAGWSPKDALADLPGSDVRELALMMFDGQPAYLATLAGGGTRILRWGMPPAAAIDNDLVARIVARAAQPERLADVGVLDRYDRYYLDRRLELPLPVVLARFNDAGETRVYIDPRSARILTVYNAHDWVSRWLYHGLHSLNFPWLYDHRPAWDVVMLTFMLGGAALSTTSILLGWRVLRTRLGGLIL